MTTTLWKLFIVWLLIFPSTTQLAQSTITVSEGVWNNFNYNFTPNDWISAARWYGEKDAVIDLVIVQANAEGYSQAAFPEYNTSGLVSFSSVDLVDLYLQRFQNEDVKVILSIQPMNIDVPHLISLIVERYGKYSCVQGVNVDLEWKLSDQPNYVNDAERDKWLEILSKDRSDLRLFLTYFKDYTHFPNDNKNLVVLFDGLNDTQTNILAKYNDLSKHFNTVGLYTGYSTSTPPVASREQILAAAPNTQYILHTDDVGANHRIVFFELDNIQAGWIEWKVIDLMSLHLEKEAPVLLGVVPYNLTNPNAGFGKLKDILKTNEANSPDIFEIGQEGYRTGAEWDLQGKSTEEQRAIIENGLSILHEAGLKPSTFIPSFSLADENTVNAAADLGFSGFVDKTDDLRSERITIFSKTIPLTEIVENKIVFKDSVKVISEIQNSTRNPIVLQYELGAFVDDPGKAQVKLIEIIDAIKNSTTYTLMTPKDYVTLLSQKYGVDETSTGSFMGIPYQTLAIAGGGIIVLLIMGFFALRKRLKNKATTVL